MPIQSLPSPRAAAARPRHAKTTMPFSLAHAQTPAGAGRRMQLPACTRRGRHTLRAASIAALSPTLSWLPTAAQAARRRACRAALQQAVPRCNRLCRVATGRDVLQQVVLRCNRSSANRSRRNLSRTSACPPSAAHTSGVAPASLTRSRFAPFAASARAASPAGTAARRHAKPLMHAESRQAM